MNIYNLQFNGVNHHFLLPVLRRSTDKIAGSFSTMVIASLISTLIFPAINYLVVRIANSATINDDHFPTMEINGKPAPEMDTQWLKWLCIPVQNNRLTSAVNRNNHDTIASSGE